MLGEWDGKPGSFAAHTLRLDRLVNLPHTALRSVTHLDVNLISSCKMLLTFIWVMPHHAHLLSSLDARSPARMVMVASRFFFIFLLIGTI